MSSGGMTHAWTPAEVLALPVVVDLVTAGSVLGMGRTAAYEAHRRGDFPVPVLCVGHRYRVVTQHLRELLGIAPEPAGTGGARLPAPPLRPVSGL